MNKNHVIDKLNEAVALEHGALHLYLQFSFLVHGQDRIHWHDFFEKKAEEALAHAKLFGNKIVAYGGVPTLQAEHFRQSQELGEMLDIALGAEKRAVEIYTQAHRLVQGQDPPLQFLLEQQILEEQEDVEELERFLRRSKVEETGVLRAA